ncbi:uncharacterized protein Dana_GF27133 [Drosophila ananassae]|uniref:BED-type domain-containing protein n=1 Tax=Drosophila ananassae TaxID=7217 RepID=A0A0P8XL59_DROAN|nr:uncharacterized protein Dana_GF27133 [Drosophila ananassae]
MKMSAKDFYGEIKDNSAKCNICSKLIKTSGNTSNLMSHLRNKHQAAYLHCVKKPTKVDVLNKSIEQISIENAFKIASTSTEKNKEITDAIVYMVCKDNLPVRSVEKEGLANLLNICVPKYNIPSRFKITELIEERYDSCVAKMRSMFQDVNEFAFTCDGVTITNSTRSYLTITAHFVRNNCLQAVCLQAVRMKQVSFYLINTKSLSVYCVLSKVFLSVYSLCISR